MSWTQFALNLAAAFVLGSLIGAERQWRQRMAGLRTNALVATGAALFVILGMPTPDNAMRVAAQVVSGIGFLGAGVIMREGLTVRGLNTKAAARLSANCVQLIANSYGFGGLERISFVNQRRTSRLVPSLSVSTPHVAVSLGATDC